MAGNTFGVVFRLTTFGESHGPALGGIVDGCPSNFALDLNAVQAECDRRRPGTSIITTQRLESDTVEWLSGIFEGKTTGAPLAFIIRNTDQRPEDYDQLRHVFRPSHADQAYAAKYGHRDHRGGGRSSARETVARVVGGAVAKQLLAAAGVKVQAFVSSVGGVSTTEPFDKLNLNLAEANAVRCAQPDVAERMVKEIERAKAAGDSLGGIITCVISGVPAGLGEPVFDKFQADLAKAMLGINAVKGFEIGGGFALATMRGSEANDTGVGNNSGGVLGGITTGSPVVFRVAFKPTSSIAQKQRAMNLSGEQVELEITGRHDPCVVPRAVPIVEAMAALTLADHWMRNAALKPL